MSKYHNKRTALDGIAFDSKGEAKRYQELKLLEKAGEIKDLRRQVPYIIIDKSEHGREIKYKADFVYIDCRTGEEVVEDFKGHRTDVYKLKRRLMAEKHGIEIFETGR